MRIPDRWIHRRTLFAGFPTQELKRPSQSEFTGKRLPCVKQATGQVEWFEGIDRVGLIGAVSTCTNELEEYIGQMMTPLREPIGLNH
ncbi:MAG: hypothetical protein O6948_09080 [Deltaproteobacteria bacterium]|nr:hypothetical protein [Deltaproteobacteria bacterium]